MTTTVSQTKTLSKSTVCSLDGRIDVKMPYSSARSHLVGTAHLEQLQKNHMLSKIKNQGNLLLTMSLMGVMSMSSAPGESAESKPLISAMSAPSSSQQSLAQMSVERTVDGNDFLQDMTDACKQLKAYTFDVATTVYKGGKTIEQKGKFYFKQPRLIRVEMTGSYKHGAVAVLGKDGKVRGHLGGALSAFTVTLAPDSDMLLGANGYPLVDSDFAGMAAVMKKFVQQGCRCQVTEHPVSAEGQSKKVYVLEFYRGASSNELYKRAYIDPKSLLPTEWFDYQNGKLYARTVWSNLNFDANLSDDLFKI